MEGFNKRQVNTLLEYLKRFENGNTQTSKTNKLEAFRNSSKCEKVDDRKTKSYNTWNQKYEKTWEIQKEIQKRR